MVTQNQWSALPLYALALFGVFGVQAVLSLFNSLVIGQIGQGVVRDLRHMLYERLQQLGLAYYDKTSSGAIIARVMDDVGAIQVFVTGQTFTILTDLGTTVAIATLLLIRDWRLALVVLAVAPLFALNFRYFMRRIRATNTIIREKMDVLFGNLKAKLDGSLVIKAYAREPEEIADFACQLDDAHVPRVQESQFGAAFSNISVAIGGVGTALVFAAGAWEVLQGRLTPGGVVSTAALAGMVFGPVARLADLAMCSSRRPPASTASVRFSTSRPTWSNPNLLKPCRCPVLADEPVVMLSLTVLVSAIVPVSRSSGMSA